MSTYNMPEGRISHPYWEELRFSPNDFMECARESWKEGYESGQADAAEEIERLRAGLVDATTLLPPERWHLLKPATKDLLEGGLS